MSGALASPAIPSPGELLRRHGLHARKSWGQHFLRDVAVHREIVRASGAGPGARVVEIGAGLGTLTAHLLETGAQVWAIERDRDLCAVLRAELGADPLLTLCEDDAVRFDFSRAADGEHPRPAVVGNLPYHLTGPLLFALLEHERTTGPWIVMVQKEVGDRLLAAPGNKTYGGLTVVLSRVRAIGKVIAVARGAFVPPPRVDSLVLRLDPRATARGDVADPRAFAQLVRAAFQRRRKTLANALSSLAPRDEVEAWCRTAAVDPRVRPEQLRPEEFAAIARAREAARA
jgi:16S rRNA (adenine1518-N6/adenine1519-N6)-dimethyltransferase